MHLEVTQSDLRCWAHFYASAVNQQTAALCALSTIAYEPQGAPCAAAGAVPAAHVVLLLSAAAAELLLP